MALIIFLIKGVLRDKKRSVLPLIVISTGVAVTVLLTGYIRGVLGDLIEQNANFETGHVKITTRVYAQNKDQLPNDLALLGIHKLNQSLNLQFPDMQWVNRIRFGGLMDVPDGSGESRGQHPVMGIALTLFSTEYRPDTHMGIAKHIVSGTMPSKPREVLLGYGFAQKTHLNVGDEFTYMGTTMYGSMSFENFIVSGMVKFGISALDKNVIIIDLVDAQNILDMEDAAGEVLGYFNRTIYDEAKADKVTQIFNSKYLDNKDEFAPIMFPLHAQNNLKGYLDYVTFFSSLCVIIFVVAMSIVLWNTGLLGGLRRYQEFGIRLALGERKGHIYRTLIYEAVWVGIMGSTIGTFFGLVGVYYLQVVGIDISSKLSNNAMLISSVLRASFTPDLLYIGFIPGLFAVVLGSMLSGIGIYKRETANLFKEMEI